MLGKCENYSEHSGTCVHRSNNIRRYMLSTFVSNVSKYCVFFLSALVVQDVFVSTGQG